MQTFLPYPSFSETAECLDYKRLGKQRVEAMQIYNILIGKSQGNAWKSHPAVKMWYGYEMALAKYYNCIRNEWIKRGYKNTMPEIEIKDNIIFPDWLGQNNFHSSHRSNLKRKNPEYYSKFNWSETNDIHYMWPK